MSDLDLELTKLETLTVGELRVRYRETFGEPTASRHKIWLIRRIAWRMQANAEGGLSERALARAKELVRESDVRLTPPRQPIATPDGSKSRTRPLPDPVCAPLTPGTILRREWKGRTVLVQVRADGFEHDGKVYRSLSAVANAITGSKWNGHVFFGLKKRSGAK